MDKLRTAEDTTDKQTVELVERLAEKISNPSSVAALLAAAAAAATSLVGQGRRPSDKDEEAQSDAKPPASTRLRLGRWMADSVHRFSGGGGGTVKRRPPGTGAGGREGGAAELESVVVGAEAAFSPGAPSPKGGA